MVKFSILLEELKTNIQNNSATLDSIIKRNPNLAFTKVNELAYFVGRRYNVDVKIHFPEPRKILDLSSYGTENIGVIVDIHRKKFPIPKEKIKAEAKKLPTYLEARDAYMYEGKEGVRLLLLRGRIEMQPGTLHVWCKIDEDVLKFLDWTMENLYFVERT
jgi:hypothetical protein